jgi:hypothetical protein
MLITDATTFVPLRCKILCEIEESNLSAGALNCWTEGFVGERAAEYLCFHTMLSNYEKWDTK